MTTPTVSTKISPFGQTLLAALNAPLGKRQSKRRRKHKPSGASAPIMDFARAKGKALAVLQAAVGNTALVKALRRECFDRKGACAHPQGGSALFEALPFRVRWQIVVAERGCSDLKCPPRPRR